MSAYADDTLIRRANFLHNAKNVRKKDLEASARTIVSVNEVWYHILKYPEMITNLNFIVIQTTSLESRTEKSLRNPDNESSSDTNNNQNQNQNKVISPNNLIFFVIF